MRKRGSSFYARRRISGRDISRSLGTDYREACRKLREFMRDEPMAISRTRVRDAAEKWLATYVATRREPRSAQLAQRRAETYPYSVLGLNLLDRVRTNDLREEPTGLCKTRPGNP